MNAPAFHLVRPPVSVAPLLSVSHVSLEYRTEQRTVRATHDVSFDVFRGDRFVLLGPSGCGKSSLLKAVAGFIAPRAGGIAMHGQPIHTPGPDRVVVFQEFDQLPPWKTVLENVMFPLLASKRLDKVAARERAHHWIAKVGLAGFEDAHPHTLSGGMKQRVAIARALAMQPEVLLMDEPFAALDAQTKMEMQEELVALWQRYEGTIVFVTHSVDEALILATKVAVMTHRPGRMRELIDIDLPRPRDTTTPEFNQYKRHVLSLIREESALAHADAALLAA